MKIFYRSTFILLSGFLVSQVPAFSSAQTVKEKKGSLAVEVQREDPLDRRISTLFILLKPGQNLFALPDGALKEEKPKLDEPVPEPFPKYFLVEGRKTLQQAEFEIAPGKYDSYVVLKSSMLKCSIKNNLAMGFCLPESKDFSCPGESFEIKAGEKTKLSLSCKKAKITY